MRVFEHVMRELLAGLPESGDVRINEEVLTNTPHRWERALRDMTSGYGVPIEVILQTFEENVDEIVCVKDMPFASLCEHHLMPFTGVCAFAYLPQDGRVVGLSKVPRMLHVLSRRLQMQERLTWQMVETFQRYVDPLGAACIMRGHHTCMSCRGIQSPGTMLTSALTGVFRTDSRARAEVLTLMNDT